MSLNLKDYIEKMDELAPGETLRVNHESCEAGEDTRQRLYLTRTQADESKVIGYCHNCQQGGAWITTSYLAFRNDKHKGATHVNVLSDECHPPTGCIPEVKAWPSAAKSWLFSNSLGQADVDTYGIAYDPTTDRVYLPRWDVVRAGSTSNSTLAGYQLRALHGYHRPKYLTGQRKDAKNYTMIAPERHCHQSAVIVEDLVSGIHIARACPSLHIYVNYGTKVDPVMMYSIAQNFKHAVVWLDNDSAHVRQQAKIMQRAIALYNEDINVDRVNDYKDPKHYSSDQIIAVIYDGDT